MLCYIYYILYYILCIKNIYALTKYIYGLCEIYLTFVEYVSSN